MDWDVRGWELIDTDDVPYIAVMNGGVCEGELADGHARIVAEVQDEYFGGRPIDLDDDGDPEVLASFSFTYDDDRSRSEYHLYEVEEDGDVVRFASIADDVPRWPISAIWVEDVRWADVEPGHFVRVQRTNFRRRTARREIWVWDGAKLVEERALRELDGLPAPH